MTGLRELAGLRIVAVIGDPPIRSWLDVPSFVCAMPDDDESVLVVDRIVPAGYDAPADRVDGFCMPVSWLDHAAADGLAFRLERPLAAEDQHRLVRVDADRFELRKLTQITSERRAALADRLDAALVELASEAPFDLVRDAFDEAYATDPHDIVTVALRAGAAGLDGAADDWRDEALEDLVRVSEHHGVLLSNLRHRPGWNRLGHPELRAKILDSATLALSHALAAPTKLLSPLSAKKIAQGAEVAARWRAHGARAYPGLSRRTLILAIKGDPHAIDEARAHATSLEESVPTLSLDRARARLIDLERYCETVYALELRTDRADRGVKWRNFLAEAAGVRGRRRPQAWQEGWVAAQSLRTALGLNGQPVRGLRKLLSGRAGVHEEAGEALEDVDALGVVGALAPPCVHFSGAGSEDRAGRSRFALAHQLCHFLLDRRLGATSSWACGSAAYDGPGTSHEEKRARAFAVWFLAPRGAVLEVAGERVSPKEQTVFVEKAMRVREHFGLTAVASGEHLQNCWGVESRGPLDEDTRLALRQTAGRAQLKDFDADLPEEPRTDVPARSALRRGLFADVLRDAYETGELDVNEIARLLGSTAVEATSWLRPEAG